MEKWTLNGLDTTDVKIVSVYDGDTIRIALPVCCKKYIFNCRIHHIDTPELRTKNTKEKQLAQTVRDYVRKLLKDCSSIRVKCYDFDKYGRVLCDITIDDELSLGEHLIEKGYAYRYDGGKRRAWDL